MKFYVKVFLLSIFLCKAGQCADKIINSIDLNNGYKLIPYQEGHKDAFKEIVNDVDVYPYIGSGHPWADQIIDARDKTYLKGNASNEAYSPESFVKCWMLTSPTGEVIGRGGFLPEVGCSPPATQIFCTIKGAYQCKNTPQLKLGSQSFVALINWFDEVIGSHKTLRWSALQSNEISKHLAVKNGFKPLMNGEQQVTVNLAGRDFLAYERG